MPPARLRPIRSLPGRAFWRLNTAVSTLGEKRNIDALTYSPLQMHAYHLLAMKAAPAVMRAVAETVPDATTYVDVGAGSGAFAAEAKRQGKDVDACERSLVGRLYARWQGVRSIPFALERTVPAELKRRYDLAYCLEVAEHLPPLLGDELVSFMCRLAPWVVFSAAQPGQGGLSHINEQPPDYWIDKFTRHGFRLTLEATQKLRERAQELGATEIWVLTNIMVFHYAD